MNKTDLESRLEKANMAERAESYFSAAILYMDALEVAVKVQDSKSIKLCKAKVVEMNKKAIAAGKDFQQVEVTQDLNEEQQAVIKKFIESILNVKNKMLVLRIIGEHPYFIPKIKVVEDQAKNSMPLAYQFATLTTISDEGHTLRGGSIGEYSWFMQMYDLNQKLIMSLYLNRLMYILIHKNSPGENLTFEDVSEYFSNADLNEKNLKIIIIGIQKYFEEDYVSAMHILVPQFESFLLNIAQKEGLNVIALDRKKDLATKKITLSDHHLDSDEFKNLFGVDFCQQIKFILFDPLGYKIRHKIAHGEITPGECNFQNTTLIFYLYLVLLTKRYNSLLPLK